MKNLSRRGFISSSVTVLGAGISFGVLTSCGNSSTSNQDSQSDFPDDLQLVQRFPQVLVRGNLRLPISLALSSGIIDSSSGFNFPKTLSAKVIDLSTDEVIIENVSATLHGNVSAHSHSDGSVHSHDAETFLPYYPFRINISMSGNYALVVSGGPIEGAAFSVLEPDQVAVPGANDSLPGFDTPTFDNNQGVKPICTRIPEPCPFHAMTLTEALKLGVPVAYLVGTPAHCQTGTCSPALDGLIEVGSRIGDRAVFIHAEVYSDEAATVIAPAVKALELTFEPVLFIVDANGKIIERFDSVFDSSEIFDALASAGIS
ncbi:hypothetical protein LBMAG16_01370 [Actinomycetes bacterium]|nr:hypothetical protein LBMAG16_01370 [Actinomycetes bacterium]